MKHLLIDTATRFTHIALCENGAIIHSFSEEGLRFQSEETLPLLITLLKEAQIPLSSIEGIFIGVGPGSFTGTRVGVAIGKTLAFSQKIPCVPFCSLLCYEPLAEGDFKVFTDAKNKKVYGLTGNKKGTSASWDNAPFLATYEEVNHLLSTQCGNISLIDPLPGSLPGAPWRVNLTTAATYCFREWVSGNYCKAQDVSVLYLRNQGDL